MNLSAYLENEFETTVNQCMQTWNIPGLAFVVVKNDKVLLAKGFGIREIGKPELVDENTLFGIGSNTKAFTATAVGMLAKEGKISLDDPVTKYLPYFKLQQPFATQLITIRDLLCHRAGLGSYTGDVLLLSNFTGEDIVRHMAYIQPAYGFRSGYGYSNLMFIAAGQIIETVSGMSWDEFVLSRIFAPMGFKNSVTNSAFFGEQKNVATPHEELRGKLQALVQRTDKQVGAAGSICASVTDMAQWLRVQLAGGSLNGQYFIDPEIISETHKTHTPIPLDNLDQLLFPTRHFSAYGLGWFLSDLHGKKVIRHTGGVDGMLSSVTMLPEEHLGIVVVTNKIPNSAHNVLPYSIIEKITTSSPQDWLSLYRDVSKADAEKTKQTLSQRDLARDTNTIPSFGLEKYTGNFQSNILGDANISQKNNKLFIKLDVHNTVAGVLEHWHYDTFLCTWDDPVLGESLIPFISDGQGHIIEFRVTIREDWVDPLEHVFSKYR